MKISEIIGCLFIFAACIAPLIFIYIDFKKKMENRDWVKKWLNYAAEQLKERKKKDQLYNSYKDNGGYTFHIHADLRNEIQPIRPIVAKLPMTMTFIDDAGRVFDYDKASKKYMFKYSSISAKKLIDGLLK